MTDQTVYPRNLLGYAGQPPPVQWPDKASIAVQFVLNYEEGGENCPLHGDAASEAFLSEIIGARPLVGQRHWNMESLYEYGARAGFWRLHRLFTQAGIPVTVYGVATAMARCPEQVSAMLQAGWEIASHGYKWIEYANFTREQEAGHIRAAIALHTEVTGKRPLGWYTGRASMNTVELVAEQGMRYIADGYADDLPYWQSTATGQQLIVPYTLDCNDMRFATAQGFNSGTQFYDYLKDSFDTLYAEGQAGYPKMLSIGLHCRLIGRPGRIRALARFIDYASSQANVWFARRIDIAEHWHQHHAYRAPKLEPSKMDKNLFIRHFGGIFEHSPWLAEQAHALPVKPGADTAIAVHHALCRAFRRANQQQRLAVLCAHPDLAGKLAEARELTPDSTEEQSSVGLDCLAPEEKTQFQRFNTAYVEKFGFPFIIAVRDHSRAQIVAVFEQRLLHDPEQEFAVACAEVERIALWRVCSLFDVPVPPRAKTGRV